MGYYAAGGLPDVIPSHTPRAGLKALDEGGHDTPPSDRPRYRRTNPGNVRALRRAMRRVQAFAKLASHTIQFTHRVKMKRHRKRR